MITVSKIDEEIYEVTVKKESTTMHKVKLSEKKENYFLNFSYLLLNLSIRPAVSISLDLPV